VIGITIASVLFWVIAGGYARIVEVYKFDDKLGSRISHDLAPGEARVSRDSPRR
jgi:hypothetical protein